MVCNPSVGVGVGVGVGEGVEVGRTTVVELPCRGPVED